MRKLKMHYLLDPFDLFNIFDPFDLLNIFDPSTFPLKGES